MIFSIKTSPRADYQDYVSLLDEFKKAKAKKISIANDHRK
jgi:biopolymer transport protein ExbD